MSDYYINKAIRAKKLYDEGKPWVKVYATVRIGDNFLVLKHNDEYMLAGGGVDENESLEEAVKRELLEELNVEVEIIKELGVYDKLYVPWKFGNEEFKVQYEIHVFDTRLIKKLDGKLGLDGEFKDNTKLAIIDKETLLSRVVEFNSFKINLE